MLEFQSVSAQYLKRGVLIWLFAAKLNIRYLDVGRLTFNEKKERGKRTPNCQIIRSVERWKS